MKIHLTILLLLSLVACKGGNDEVLATFEGGKILRKDMRQFYEFREIPINENTTSIKTQTKVIENIALQTIIEGEGKKNNLENNQSFKDIFNITERQLVTNLYTKNFLEKAKKNKRYRISYSSNIVCKKRSEWQSKYSEERQAVPGHFSA